MCDYKEMSAITFHYFDAYARAESTRMMLNHSGTAFTDHRIKGHEWPALQASGLGEFMEIPVLEIDGLKLAQSRSINRYLTQKLGYNTTNHYDEYLVESICDLRNDFIVFFEKFLVSQDLEGFDKEIKTSGVEWIKLFEARLAQNKNGAGWFVGNKITRADFEIFQCVHDLMIRDDFGSKYAGLVATHAPKLKAFIERFKESSSGMRAYMQNRPKALF